MPRFSEYFELGLTQHELDFVDVSNTFDTPVYVDPYAIETQNDLWCEEASENIRTFFHEVLHAIRNGDTHRANNLMSHLTEPKETFLGVSKDDPRGRGVGRGQASQLITAIRQSKAYKTGLLVDLSDMALYVDGVDRDKISDLTTNIIRNLLVDYTQQQCELHDVETIRYASPAMWDSARRNWVARHVQLPQMDDQPILLVPKYIVRRSLSINSHDFYNRQITDFLVAENLKANSSLVQTVRSGPKVYKGAVREQHPKSKSFIAEIVSAHPDLLLLYKEVARRQGALLKFDDGDGPTITAVCGHLAEAFSHIPSGRAHATDYHNLILGSMTALFYPLLIQPRKEWDIQNGRKRIDIVFTNSGERGFFSQRRDDTNTHANVIIVECKNYSKDIANPELDQLIGRFDDQRGRLGIIACRSVEDQFALRERCRDAAVRKQGYMLVLTDDDLISMLKAKAQLKDDQIEQLLNARYRDLLA